MKLAFTKYHGLGNDFLVVDGRDGVIALEAPAVRALCERHRGVGADGVLTLTRAASADVHMRVQNADGSDSAMCGNGLRCVARYLYDVGAVAQERSHVKVAAGRAVYTVERLGPSRFRVDMGVAEVDDPSLPPQAVARRAFDVRAHDRVFSGFALALGNPHLVLFVDDSPAALAARYGAELERHPAFPERVNVSFARPQPSGFEVVVFERGAGITQACGSGACAVAVAARWAGLWPTDAPTPVSLPGGTLVVSVASGGRLALEGEAVRVFAGEVDVP